MNKNWIWEYLDEKSKKVLAFAGIYIISGASFALIEIFQNVQYSSISILLLFILMSLIFVFALVTGVMLLRRKGLGINFMKVLMALQVLGLQAFGFKYFLYLGVVGGIEYNWDESSVFNFFFKMGFIDFNITLDYDEYGDVGFFINIIPIIFIRYLLKIENEASERRELAKLDS